MSIKFTKNDLRTGHIVRFRNGETAMLVGDTFFCSMDILDGDFNNGQLNQYDEYLKDIKYGYDTDIMEVYYIKSTEYDLGVKRMIENIPEEHVELVWKREEKIDWNKVPKFTKVQVRNGDNEEWKNRHFVRYCPELSSPYRATICNKFTYEGDYIGSYSQIRIYNKNDIKQEWYK